MNDYVIISAVNEWGTDIELKLFQVGSVWYIHNLTDDSVTIPDGQIDTLEELKQWIETNGNELI